MWGNSSVEKTFLQQKLFVYTGHIAFEFTSLQQQLEEALISLMSVPCPMGQVGCHVQRQ